MEEDSNLRQASAELTGAIIEDLGKQYMLSLQVNVSTVLTLSSLSCPKMPAFQAEDAGSGCALTLRLYPIL